MKILVPCDGSKPSRNALKKAVELLLLPRTDSYGQKEIILIYVVPYIEVPTPFDESGMMSAESAPVREYIKQMYSYQKEHALEMLQDISDNLVIDQNDKDRLTSRIEILYGNPAERIIEFAHKEKVNVIVLGNVGLSGFSRLKALGSVSRSVSERAEVPVMIVPFSE
jgi:nucleotide-binding universal stress UspA family protein